MTQLFVNNFGEQKSCATPHPPLRETDVTEGGLGGGGAIALLVPLHPHCLMDYVMCSEKKISVRHRPHVGITR